MKTLKALIPFLFIASALGGCSAHRSDPTSLENITGTYELATYSAKRTLNPDEEIYDRKADEGIVAYFTIDADGYGYYGYKDNKTAPWVESIWATYTPNTRDESLISDVSINDGVTHCYEWEWKVGCLDEPPMGIQKHQKNAHDNSFVNFIMGNKKVTEYTLSYTVIAHHNEFHDVDVCYQHVLYKKVSSETGYEEINRRLGTSYKPTKPFELKTVKGCLVYRCQPKDGSGLSNKGNYEYAIIDMSRFNDNKLKLYYSLKANPGQQILEIPVTVYEKGKSVRAQIFGRNYISNGVGFSVSYSDYTEEDEIKYEGFNAFYSADLTLEQTIEAELLPSV